MYQRHRRKSTEKSNDTEPKTQKAIFIDSVNFTHSERICFEIEFVDTDQNYVQHALKEFGKDYGKNQDKGNHEFTFQNWTLKEHTNDIIWVSQDSVDKEISTDVWDGMRGTLEVKYEGGKFYLIDEKYEKII